MEFDLYHPQHILSMNVGLAEKHKDSSKAGVIDFAAATSTASATSVVVVEEEEVVVA